MKNRKAILLLFAANSISGCAQGISMIAIPWYFVDVLKQPALFSNIYLAVTIFSVFWGLYAGTLVDRLNRKHLFIGENAFGALWLGTVAAIGFNMGSVPTPLAGLVFSTTFLTYNIHYPTLYAFAQEITEKKDYGRITSWLEIQGQLTSAAAGGFGALLLNGIESGNMEWLGYAFSLPISFEAWSLPQVFLLDASTYALSFLLILPIRYTAISQRFQENVSLWKRLQTGIRFFRVYPIIFVFATVASFVFVTTMLVNYVLAPNFVKNYLLQSADVYAIGEVCFAVGAIVSAAFIAHLLQRSTKVMGAILTLFISALTFLFLVFNRSLIGYYLALLALGLANSGSRIMRVTYIFHHIPNQLIGRTSSVSHVANVMMRAFFIGLFGLPFFIEGVPYAFLLFAFCCFLAAGILIWHYRDLVDVEVEEEEWLQKK
ncbi:MAG: MFS transporter [Chitinophagales bacterium]